LLLRLEHAPRSALEDHVHRAPRLGGRGLLNVRIGIRYELLPMSPGWTRGVMVAGVGFEPTTFRL
jgi:hypothetical protein